MPGLLHPTRSASIWSSHAADVGFDQLQKFWTQLPPEARQELLKVDKQTLFEQARKNLYCSRCNGLLLEGFSQIVVYGKSSGSNCEDEVQDPSVHPWGGLATTRDGALTVLDCFVNARSLKALQNVFNSARARERERELLYPDACGGGGRGWISQGMVGYGRGHGTRETCALHTARLSCDTLVDFWSALSDETRLSLLRMKEEDFIERLMYRFDSKRFCRDCRRNVIREFKELKELKRMRREPRCSSWFCVADTAFQYEVSEDTVQADWHQSFTESVGTYHHFEWAIGTGEGKSDILEFEDVGMNGKVYMDGLDLGDLSACFITLRAWKLDGRCTELCVKAHALKGQPCVHRRLIVGDGFVTITKGESIREFFEHAEEVEEEEDDDVMDKDGNEYDADGSRPQKHAKSPELAREFLLDAATVIFKEQVEKAFREGTARQNAHSIFVCLSLKLLEDRIHVACKEIITLEKQIKLLEEEEKDRREEEERKERRRIKEREKKHRRKERLKGKERERERKHMEPELIHFALPACNESSTSTHGDSPNMIDSGDSISEAGDFGEVLNSISPEIRNEQSLDGLTTSENLKSGSVWHQCHVDGEFSSGDGNGSFELEQSKSSRRKLRVNRDSFFDRASKCYDNRQPVHSDESSVQHHESDRKTHGYAMDTSRCMNGVVSRSSREDVVKTNTRPCNLKYSEKFHCSNSRTRDRYDFQSCSCNQQDDHRTKDDYTYTTIRTGRVIRSTNKTESSPDGRRSLFRSSKYNHGCGTPDNSITTKGKIVPGALGREPLQTKQVWEPMDARKKCIKSSLDPDSTLRNAAKTDPPEVFECDKDEKCCDIPHSAPDGTCSSEFSRNSCEILSVGIQHELEDGMKGSKGSDPDTLDDPHNKFGSMTKPNCYSKDDTEEEAKLCPGTPAFLALNDCDPIMSSSSSDNFSSCPSEGDSSTSSSVVQNAGSSSTSDSEDACQQSDGRYTSTCNGNASHELPDDVSNCKTKEVTFTRTTTGFPADISVGAGFSREDPINTVTSSCNGRFGFDMPPPEQHMLPMHDQVIHVPVFPPSTMGYHNQRASLWSPTPSNGLMPFPHRSHYVFPSPFGYGLTANHSPGFQMQYNTVQPLTTPIVSVQQRPLYQSTDRVYVPSTRDNIKKSDVPTAQPELPRTVHPLESPCSNRQLSSVGQNDTVENVAKPNSDAPSFSLFHFGGPMAGAAGYNVNPISLKEHTSCGFVSNLPAAQKKLSCSKEETKIEEYSLFAASTGARFSFFYPTS